MEGLQDLLSGHFKEYLLFLNWYYIIIYSIIAYGIEYYSKLFDVIQNIKIFKKKLFSENPYKNLWLTGIYIAIVFLFLDVSIEWSFNGFRTYLSSILHSYFIAAVFNSFIDSIINKFIKKTK